MAANEVTAIRIPAGVRGAPGAGISAAQWAALQAIVPSDTTGQINAPNVTSQGQLVAGASNGSSTHRLIGHERLEGDGTTPTLNWGTAGGTAATVSITGSDSSGHLSITVGTSPSGAADAMVIEVTLRNPFSSSTFHIQLSPRDADAAGAQVYAISTATNKWEIRLGRAGALVVGTQYIWNYRASQGIA